MECRRGCGACCVVISISSSLPGMPLGKPAGVRCANLSAANECRVHGTAAYPAVCAAFTPDPARCGTIDADAYRLLAELERLTEPDRSAP
ncbi:MAG TPA: YkgJ family cysteine cluster protein [Treponemataceae bacterium]|nr:YkgJ family cysteine cluster protein [Treponemataceae bacterium]